MYPTTASDELAGASHVRATEWATVDTPVPVRFSTVVPPEVALLVSVTVPVAAPAAVGSNCRFSVAVCPGLSVTGNVTPDMLYPVPASVPALMVSAVVPDEVSVTVCVDGVFRSTFPNATVVDPTDSAGPFTLSCTANVLVTPPAVAVIVAVVAVVTAVAVAVKDAVVALAGTVTEAGTVTALLLLESETASPLAPAAAFSVTVQASVVAPVSELSVQETALSAPVAAAVPVPLSVTTLVPPVPALLLMVIDPLAAPAVVGSNFTVSVTVCPGFSVAGKVPPVTVKPVPESVAELIVSADVPDDVSVTVCVVDVFTVTSPNDRLVALSVSCGATLVSCRANVLVNPPAEAARVAVVVVLTVATVALKAALVALAGTVTEAGTLTELLLLDRFTTCPFVPAAALSVTVHASVPALV